MKISIVIIALLQALGLGGIIIKKQASPVTVLQKQTAATTTPPHPTITTTTPSVGDADCFQGTATDAIDWCIKQDKNCCDMAEASCEWDDDDDHTSGGSKSVTICENSCNGIDACRFFDIDIPYSNDDWMTSDDWSTVTTTTTTTTTSGEVNHHHHHHHHHTRTIYSGSCIGTSSCYMWGWWPESEQEIHITIGPNSCEGKEACMNVIGNVAEDSCLGPNACIDVGGSVGNESCRGESACEQIKGSVGNNSCHGEKACTSVVYHASGGDGDSDSDTGGGSSSSSKGCTVESVGNDSCGSLRACYCSSRVGDGIPFCGSDQTCLLYGETQGS